MADDELVTCDECGYSRYPDQICDECDQCDECCTCDEEG